MGFTAWRSAWHANMRRPFLGVGYICTSAVLHSCVVLSARWRCSQLQQHHHHQPSSAQHSHKTLSPFSPLSSSLCFVQLVVSGQALETWEMGLGPGAGLAKGGAFCRIQWRPAPNFVRCLHDTVPSQWGRADTALYVVARLRGAPAARMHASTNARTHARTKRGGGGSWRNGAPHLSQEQAAFDGEAKRQRCPSEGGGNSAAVLPLSLSRLVLGTSRSYGTYHTASPFTKTPKSCATAQTKKAIPVLVTKADWAAGVRGAMQGIDFR